MPNPGHPSRGCNVCRAMKVKCDETRPACARCLRGGRVCTGYRDESEIFRHTFQSSKNGKVRRQHSPESQDSTTARFNPGSTTARSLVLRRPTPSPTPTFNLPRPMSNDWTAQAINLFFAEYVDPPDFLRSTWGFYEYLPAMYGACSSVHLVKAVEAAALAHLANTSSIDRLAVLARSAYGKALLDLGAALRSKTRATADETLATLSLLANYEIITGEQPFGETFHAHFRGQSTLIRMRGSAQFSSPVGRSLFATTNRVLLWRDLADQKRPTLGVADWPHGVYASWLGDISARLSGRIADVCGRARELKEVAIGTRDEVWVESLREVIREVLDTDQEVQRNIDDAPADWRWQSLPTRSPSPCVSTSASSSAHQSSDTESSNSACASLFPRVVEPSDDAEILEDQKQTSPYPLRIGTYPTKAVATLWNTVRCARLHLFHTLYELFLLLQWHPIWPPPSLPTPAVVRGIVLATVNDICASVPYLLGDIDTNGNLRCFSSIAGDRGKLSNSIVLLWSLHKVCRVPNLEPGLKAWVVKILKRIGTVGEMRQALNLSRMHSTS